MDMGTQLRDSVLLAHKTNLALIIYIKRRVEKETIEMTTRMRVKGIIAQLTHIMLCNCITFRSIFVLGGCVLYIPNLTGPLFV